MVAVAGVALTTSTYAWFVSNGTVQATGMSVNATTDDSLLIKGSEDGQNYGSIGTANISALTMKPTTSSDGEKFARLGDDVEVEKAYQSNATWSNAGEFQNGDLVELRNLSGYVASATYQIKSTTAETSIYVSGFEITGVQTGQNMDKAIRVSVKIGETTKVYKPATDAANTDSKVGGIEADKWVLVSDSNIYQGIDDDATWNLGDANTPNDAVVNVWFEGQDTNCYTDDISNTGMSVTVKFSKHNAPA